MANADTSAIWAAVSEADGGRDIAGMMGAWVTQVGFPVVTVAKSEGGDGLGGVFSGLLVCFRFV
jgi:aminopeptidase N